jgi:hypothetical protein
VPTRWGHTRSAHGLHLWRQRSAPGGHGGLTPLRVFTLPMAIAKRVPIAPHCTAGDTPRAVVRWERGDNERYDTAPLTARMFGGGCMHNPPFQGSKMGLYLPLIRGFITFNPTTSLDMPLCMPSCIRHDCLSICLICNVPSCCESHLMDLIERWQPHRSIGAM